MKNFFIIYIYLQLHYFHIHFIPNFNNFNDISLSTIHENIIKISIIIDIIECAIIWLFIFSFLLSPIIVLYNFILLTPIVNIAGINIMFCGKNAKIQNNKPFGIPRVNTIPR